MQQINDIIISHVLRCVVIYFEQLFVDKLTTVKFSITSTINFPNKYIVNNNFSTNDDN